MLSLLWYVVLTDYYYIVCQQRPPGKPSSPKEQATIPQSSPKASQSVPKSSATGVPGRFLETREEETAERGQAADLTVLHVRWFLASLPKPAGSHEQLILSITGLLPKDIDLR